MFNLIPIPPLDGSKILFSILPGRMYYKMMQFERYFGIILWILVLSNLLDPFLSNGTEAIYNLYYNFFNIIFASF